jgi:hypothetical protein
MAFGTPVAGSAAFTTATPQVTGPGTVNASDILCFFIVGTGTYTINTAPSGFTLVGTAALVDGASADTYTTLYYKICDGSEDSLVMQATLDNANADGICGYIHIPGGTSPTLHTSSEKGQSGSNASITGNAVTPNGSGDMVVSFFGQDGPTTGTTWPNYTWTTSSGGTITDILDTNGSLNAGIGIAYEVAAGATSRTHTCALAANTDSGNLHTLVFKEGAGGGLSFVSDTQASSWAVRQLITDTQASAWATRQQLSKTQQSTWSVRALVSQTRQSAWAVRRFISQTRASAWDVASSAVTSFISKTQASAWAVRSLIADTQASAWQIRALVTDTQSSAWHTRALASKSQQSQWHVRALVSKTAASSWRVRQLISRTRQSAWNLAGRITKTWQSAWNTLALTNDPVNFSVSVFPEVAFFAYITPENIFSVITESENNFSFMVERYE